MRVVVQVKRGGGQVERCIIFCYDTDKILCGYGFV